MLTSIMAFSFPYVRRREKEQQKQTKSKPKAPKKRPPPKKEPPKKRGRKAKKVESESESEGDDHDEDYEEGVPDTSGDAALAASMSGKRVSTRNLDAKGNKFKRAAALAKIREVCLLDVLILNLFWKYILTHCTARLHRVHEEPCSEDPS